MEKGARPSILHHGFLAHPRPLARHAEAGVGRLACRRALILDHAHGAPAAEVGAVRYAPRPNDAMRTFGILDIEGTTIMWVILPCLKAFRKRG